MSSVGAAVFDDVDPREIGAELAGERTGAVAGAVVDDDPPVGGAGLCAHRRDEAREVVGFVACRGDDQRPRAHRAEPRARRYSSYLTEKKADSWPTLLASDCSTLTRGTVRHTANGRQRDAADRSDAALDEESGVRPPAGGEHALHDGVGVAATELALDQPAGSDAVGGEGLGDDGLVAPHRRVAGALCSFEEVGVVAADQTERRFEPGVAEEVEHHRRTRRLLVAVVPVIGARRPAVAFVEAAVDGPGRRRFGEVGQHRSGDDVGIVVDRGVHEPVEPVGLRGLVVVDEHDRVGEPSRRTVRLRVVAMPGCGSWSATMGQRYVGAICSITARPSSPGLLSAIAIVIAGSSSVKRWAAMESSRRGAVRGADRWRSRRRACGWVGVRPGPSSWVTAWSGCGLTRRSGGANGQLGPPGVRIVTDQPVWVLPVEHGCHESRAVRSFLSCGVRIDALDVASAAEAVVAGTARGAVHLCNAYTLSLAARDDRYAARLCAGRLNLPDGMPLVWITKWLGLAKQARRVSGTSLMEAVCAAGVDRGLRHYLFGSTPEVVAGLEAELGRRFPGVSIVGAESPPFGDFDEAALDAATAQFAAAGADVVWVGLGTPKQDVVVSELAARSDLTFVADRRGVRLHRRVEADGAAGAGRSRPRVAVPPGDGAASLVAAVSGGELGVRRREPASAAAGARFGGVTRSSDQAADCVRRWRCAAVSGRPWPCPAGSGRGWRTRR